MAGMIPKINKGKLDKWLVNAFSNDETPSFWSIDIDAFYVRGQQNLHLNPEYILHSGCLIFDYVGGFLLRNEHTTPTHVSFLSISLINVSPDHGKKPEDLKELINQIDITILPELLVYKPVSVNEFPYNEFHRIPLEYKIFDFCREVNIIYKQTRSLEEMLSNENYFREVSLYF